MPVKYKRYITDTQKKKACSDQDFFLSAYTQNQSPQNMVNFVLYTALNKDDMDLLSKAL
jgi:hypothetical protein